MKSMALSKYFEIVRPQYVFLKLTPLKSLRNYNSDKIINAISTVYRKFTQQIIKDHKKYFFTIQCKMSYYIYMEKNKVEFYFVLPVDYKTLLKDKINDCWKGIAIEEVDSVPEFRDKCFKYDLRYKKEDVFSLCTDKRNNVLLSSLMNTMNVMEEDDRLGVIYNFIPCAQNSWRDDYNYYMKKFKEGYPTEKQKTGGVYILKLMGTILLYALGSVIGALSEFAGEKMSTPVLIGDVNISPETRRKRDDRIVNTQIVILSQSNNWIQANNNAVSACEAFKSLTGDNELLYQQYSGNFNITDKEFKGANKMKITPIEGQNFLSLPAKELIEEHKIKCIDVFETNVPKELSNGIISVGKSTYRGNVEDVYLCNDIQLRNLSLAIVGSNRSGKTTLISNLVHDMYKAGECSIIFDFCGKCELSDEIERLFPDNCLSIDCSDFDKLQGMAYNEIDSREQNVFKRYRNAKMQTVQLMTLINCINEEDKALKARMDRYLEAACLVVFVGNGSVKDVIGVLQDCVLRGKYIREVDIKQEDNLREYIDSLRELDEKGKDGVVIGTKHNLISGILDRITALKKNTYFELMLKKDSKGNFNLLHEIQKNQIICLRMPECMFSISIEKDVYCTYWFTKIWLALQLRKNDVDEKDHVKVNIFVDELYQIEKCQGIIASKLSQMPKFTAKMIVTCHYLRQIPVLRGELRASNANYMLLQGSNVANFNELKAEFGNLGYGVDDLLNLQRYHALCLLSYEEGYWAGVVKMPSPKRWD